ncbi:MAG: glycosyltransferase family 1 protein [Sphingobacteriaceae bacterium]|nr:MAG: glycosyltransferase family 1 protein [Sphingobacteriaceae bacterium]
MKIGYDAKRAFHNTTGLGNYSRWLIKIIAEFYPDNKLYLCTPKDKQTSFTEFIKQHINIHVLTAAQKPLKWLWRSRGVVNDLKQEGVNLYHGLSHELPFSIARSGIKTIVTVHDVIVLRNPELFGKINAAIYTFKLKHACKTADKILAISKKTADDLIELLRIDPKKIKVIYQGADEVFKQPANMERDETARVKYNLPEKYLLSVGTVEERKNLMLTVKALTQVPDIPLVVVGRQTCYAEKVKEYALQNDLSHRIIFLENVTFTELPSIYRQAEILIYPSRYEGFGLPVLEALYSGTPVIAATGSCLEEAGGPGSMYITPDDEDALADNINELLTDEPLRQNMISEGKKYAQKFDDAKLAEQLIDIYREIV